MRKIILHICFVIAGITAYGQQLPQYTFFTYNYLNYNPAVTGQTSCLEIKVGYRRQWTGIQDGPRTGFAVAHGKFGVKKRYFHGAGVLVESDASGPFASTNLFANYAIHLKVGRRYTWSTGIGVGFTQYRINFGNMFLEQQNVDPVITSSISEFVFPQINFGMWLYRSDQFFGISMRQLTSNNLNGLPNTNLATHLTLAYGKAVKVNEELMFKPAFLMNYVGKSKASIEAQALLTYNERFSMGLAARSGNGISALAKFDMLKHLTLAYAYDLTVSRLRYDGANTHEITLGIRACEFDEKPHVPCAAYD